MNRSPLLLLALGALVGLSGCAEYGYAGQRSVGYDRYPDDRYSSNDHRNSTYYRRVERDARDYANYLDRVLRLRNSEERRIRQILEDRTYDLLRRTRVNRHDNVYPFPRRSGRSQGFWRQIDRDIERVLDYQYHEPYGYLNRYGETRYVEYYRYRSYDSGRRVWYNNRDRGNNRDQRYQNQRSNDDGERRPNNSNRNTNQRDDRQDNRSARQDNRQENRVERQDNRQNNRVERQDNRQNNRVERQDNRQNNRVERQDNRQENSTERPGNRQETRTERQGNRSNSRAQQAPARTNQQNRATTRRVERNQ